MPGWWIWVRFLSAVKASRQVVHKKFSRRSVMEHWAFRSAHSVRPRRSTCPDDLRATRSHLKRTVWPEGTPFVGFQVKPFSQAMFGNLEFWFFQVFSAILCNQDFRPAFTWGSINESNVHEPEGRAPMLPGRARHDLERPQCGRCKIHRPLPTHQTSQADQAWIQLFHPAKSQIVDLPAQEAQHHPK